MSLQLLLESFSSDKVTAGTPSISQESNLKVLMLRLLSFSVCGGERADDVGDLRVSGSVWLQRGGGEGVGGRF